MAIIQFSEPSPSVGVDILGVYYSLAFNKIKANDTTTKIKKENKIYNLYNIPANEKILAYCQNSLLGLSFGGFIFTDEALYIYSKFQSKCITYKNLCDYIVVYNTSTCEAKMCNSTNDYIIHNEKILIKNSIGKEISIFLTEIQKAIFIMNPTLENDFLSVVSYYKDIAKTEMQTGMLSESTQRIFTSLLEFPFVSASAINILAENLFKLCNEKAYLELINTSGNYISNEEIDLYNTVFADDFRADLLNSLLDINRTFSEEYINETKHNLKDSIPRDSELFPEKVIAQINICLSTRKNNAATAREEIAIYQDAFGNTHELHALIKFVCIYGNIQMKTVISEILQNNVVPQHLYGVIDSLGFTPLHYAIFLNNSTTIKDLISNEIYNNSFKYIENKDIKNLYKYTTLAAIADSADLANIYRHIDEDLLILQSKINDIEKQIAFKQKTLKVQETALYLGKTQLRQLVKTKNTEAIEEQREKVDNLQSIIKEKEEDIQELRFEITEVENEIIEVTEKNRLSVLKDSEDLKLQNNPFANFILNLYATIDQNLIAEYLNSSNVFDYNFFEYEKFYFALPTHIDIKIPKINL